MSHLSRWRWYIIFFLGGGAQCPQRYSLVGDKCLWFMTELKVNFTTAAEICDFEGGSLAKLDDCNLQADLVEFIESNGEHTRSIELYVEYNRSIRLKGIDARSA